MDNNKIFEVIAELRNTCWQRIEVMNELISKDFRLDRYSPQVRTFKEILSDTEEDMEPVELLVHFREVSHKMIEVEGQLVNDYLSFGHYDQIVTKDVYIFMCKVMRKLIFSDTWRGKKRINHFKIIEKEALNAKIWYTLLIKRMYKENKSFDLNVIVAYLIKRLIRKGSFWDSKPENKKRIIKEVPEFETLIIDDAMETARKVAGDLFIAEINYLASKVTVEERFLFKQAKALATAIEFEQIKEYLYFEDIPTSQSLVEAELLEFDKEGLYHNEKLMNLFRRISWSRFTDRWEMYVTPLGCNLLAHSETAAVFNWLMAIEEGKFNKSGLYFGISLFHDDPEMWTDDVPSPIKDRILTNKGVTLREICDVLEIDVSNEFLYPALPEEIREYYSNNIDMNGISPEDHAFTKKGDYLSADYEVVLSIAKGSCEKELADVILKDFKATPRTSESHKLLEYFIEQMNNRFIDI